MNQNLSTMEYEAFCDFLKESCGINLGTNKHYLVKSRLNKLLAENKIDSIGDLLRRMEVKNNFQLKDLIIDAMTTNETFWFRDNYPFEALKCIAFPRISERNPDQIRIWSTACATGQEPYSISIVSEEFYTRKLASPKVQILATDISPTSLQIAQIGQYDKKSLIRGMSKERQDKYFVQDEELWTVNNKIKSRIQFRLMNLLNSYSTLGRFDVIFCRNVLIYFAPDLKKNITDRMIEALAPNGYLFLGSSETVQCNDNKLKMIKSEYGIFYQLQS